MQSCIYSVFLFDLHWMVSCSRHSGELKIGQIVPSLCYATQHRATKHIKTGMQMALHPHITDCCVINALPCTSALVSVTWGCDTDRWPQRLIDQRQDEPVCVPARHGCVSGASDDVCPCSNSGRRGWVHGIHFIWMGTVRMMMINTANPPVCFVLGIRIAQRIHWSFHWGDLEWICNKTLNLFGLHRALYVSCLWCQIMFSNCWVLD